MTINIPFKAVAFVLYTLALLGGAFGISYAVFEWRDDEPIGIDLSAIEQKIDALEQQSGAGPTQAELDAQRCVAALEAAGQALSREPISIGGIERAPLVPQEIQGLIDRYCK